MFTVYDYHQLQGLMTRVFTCFTCVQTLLCLIKSYYLSFKVSLFIQGSSNGEDDIHRQIRKFWKSDSGRVASDVTAVFLANEP